LAVAARQPLLLRGVVSQELEMPNNRPKLAFFALIAASLCAAVLLVGLLIAGDVPANGFTYSVDSGVYQDAAMDGVPEDWWPG
jgi:hypothetical protein